MKKKNSRGGRAVGTPVRPDEKRTMAQFRRQVRGGGIMPSVPGLNFRDTQFRRDGGVKNSARFVVNIAVDGRVKVWSWSVPVHGPVAALTQACAHLARVRRQQYSGFPDSAGNMMDRAIADFLSAGKRGYPATAMSADFRAARKALSEIRRKQDARPRRF